MIRAILQGLGTVRHFSSILFLSVISKKKNHGAFHVILFEFFPLRFPGCCYSENNDEMKLCLMFICSCISDEGQWGTACISRADRR